MMTTGNEVNGNETPSFDSISCDDFLMTIGDDDAVCGGIAIDEVPVLEPMLLWEDTFDMKFCDPLRENPLMNDKDSWFEDGQSCSIGKLRKANADSISSATPPPVQKPLTCTTPHDTSNPPQQASQSVLSRTEKMSYTRTSQRLPADFSPGNYDVICLGRGRSATSHPGNRRFQITVQIYLDKYLSCRSKCEKSVVVSEIVDTIRDCSHGGGFVKHDLESGRWVEVGDSVAREKVGQALRNMQSVLQRQRRCSQAKKTKRKEVFAKSHSM